MFGRRASPPVMPARRGRRLLLLSGLLALVLAGRGAADAAARWRFSVNMTDSLRHWAFLVDRRDTRPQRGELVAFSPPPNRWFAPDAVFAKQVVGLPGDLVERRGRAFFVAGRYVGAAKLRTRDGAPTTLGPVGVIPSGRYFVVTPHADSLDSRYAEIGWVGRDRIIGVARPIL